MSMGWVAAGTAILGAYSANQAANKQQAAAADAQAKALGYQDAAQQRAIEEQQRQFDLTRQDTATQRAVGDKALNYLSDALQSGGQFGYQPYQMPEYQQSPGYQFQLEQGAKARQIGLGSQGMQLSGRAQKELERYGQGVASQDYGNWFNRQMAERGQTEAEKQNYLSRQFGLAGIGSQGISTATGAGQNMANQASNIYTNTGANQANLANQYGTNLANIYGGQAQNTYNAVTGGVNNYLAYKQNQDMMNMFNNQMKQRW